MLDFPRIRPRFDLTIEDNIDALDHFTVWVIGMAYGGPANTEHSVHRGVYCVVIDDRFPVYVKVSTAAQIVESANELIELQRADPHSEFCLLCVDWLEPNERFFPTLPFKVIDAQLLFQKRWDAICASHQDGVIGHLFREIGDHLRYMLNSLPHGRETAYRYEDLLEDIFKFAFAPDIQLSASQSANFAKTQVRDSVFQINTERGVWGDTIKRQHANSITFALEAKNLGRNVRSAEVRQLAGYLKPSGVGSFGILVSRLPPAPTAWSEAVLQRQGRGDPPKTILLLDDDDIAELIARRQFRSLDACNAYLVERLVDLLKLA